MKKILDNLAEVQADFPDISGDVTIHLIDGTRVTGIIESTIDGVVSISRRLTSAAFEYADIPRHYAISAVIGAYFTESS